MDTLLVVLGFEKSKKKGSYYEQAAKAAAT